MAASQNGKPLFYAGLMQMDGADCRIRCGLRKT
jgi:hypothetical protein